MEIERVALLVNRLSEKSKAGTLPWESETSNSFIVNLGKYQVSISEHYDDNVDPEYGDPDYAISIYRGGNKAWIDSFNDYEMKDVLPNSFKIMQKIYRDARRTASGISAVVEDLLQQLGNDES